jgi:hypothetical protein
MMLVWKAGHLQSTVASKKREWCPSIKPQWQMAHNLQTLQCTHSGEASAGAGSLVDTAM